MHVTAPEPWFTVVHRRHGAEEEACMTQSNHAIDMQF